MVSKNNSSHTEKTKTTITALQKLNNALREKGKSSNIEQFTNDINNILSLEENNFKTTLNIFLFKLECFDLLQKDEDDYKVLQKEKEIAQMKKQLALTRTEISDIITSLKYQYI